MFESDTKDYTVVIDRMILMIDEQPALLIQVVDVIFKWVYLKLDEITSLTFIMKMYDFLGLLFAFLIDKNYALTESEAYVIIPMLCEKAGHNNTIIKNKIKALIKQCFKLHEHTNCLSLIINFGCFCTKNLKSASESLDEVASWISKDELNSIDEKQIKQITKLVEHSDQGVRKGALQVLD